MFEELMSYPLFLLLSLSLFSPQGFALYSDVHTLSASMLELWQIKL